MSNRVPLTIHLIRSEFDDFSVIVQGGEVTRTPLPELEGELVMVPSEPHQPHWAAYFQEIEPQPDFGLVNQSGAILLLRTSDRVWALTFGNGRHHLNRDTVEDRFGLKVVLNTIAADRIRSMDLTTFDRLQLNARLQSSRNATAGDFGLDVEKDLVKAVHGKSEDRILGGPIGGRDHLSCALPVGLDHLRTALQRCLELYRRDDYRRNFEWADFLQPITDHRDKARLDAELIRLINEGDFQRCWLGAPEVIDFDDYPLFGFSASDRRLRRNELDFSDLLYDKRTSVIDLSRLRNWAVYTFGLDGTLGKRWSLYKCLNCELDLEGASYVLSDGSWYRTDRDFVKELDEFCGRLPAYERSLPPLWANDGGKLEPEEAYNKRATDADSGLCLLDQKIIKIRSKASPVEVCDLFSDERDFIHVKKYGGSQPLVYLFQQALVSAQCFNSDSDFRRKFNDQLGASWKLEDPAASPDCRDYRVVAGVVGGPDLPEKFPFFARVSLRQVVRNSLIPMGYRFSIAHIPVGPPFTKCPPRKR